MSDQHPSEAQLEELRQRWSENGTPRAFVQLADAYRRRGELELAVATLEEGLGRHPEYQPGWVALGRAQLAQELPTRAATTLQRVVLQDPTHLVASKLLVEVEIARGDALQARRRLDHYAGLQPADEEVEEMRERIQQLQLTDLDDDETEILQESSRATSSERVEEEPLVELPPPLLVRGGDDPFGEIFAAPDLDRLVTGLAEGGVFAVDLSSRDAASEVEEASQAEDAPPADVAREPAAETPAQEAESTVVKGYTPHALFIPEPFIPPGDSSEEASEEPAADSDRSLEPDEEAAPVRVAGFEVPEADSAEGTVDLDEAEDISASTSPADLPETPPEAAESALDSSWAVTLGGAAAAGAATVFPGGSEAAEISSAEDGSEDGAGEDAAGKAEISPPGGDGSEADAPATTTLGELYLAQGHLDEAEKIFRQVLANEPGEAAARRGLAAVAEARRGVTAQELLGDFEGGTAQGKVHVLKRYLNLLRKGSQRDVS